MPQAPRKPQSQTQHRSSVSFSQPRSENYSSVGAESRTQLRKKKNKFVFVKIKGLGCKGTSIPAPLAPKSALQLRQEDHNHGRGKQPHCKNNSNKRRPENVVVDIPDVCCTPPGIGIASDFAPRSKNTDAGPRLHHRKHSRETRRHGNEETVINGTRADHHRSAEEAIQMLMAQQTLPYNGIIDLHDQYQNWRLNVDDMSYEELLELSDKIGHVGTGLQEEEISNCIRKFKHNITSNSTSWQLMNGQKDWKCSICQEKCRKYDEIGRLDCGHYHHVQCIKQWLLQKNQCPICKSAAIPK
ncbi:E3 ubiquitin-protein ligase MBR1-like [Andrographis paniculata]|uniref:E3 ubiquitin-protein ligase MBR1-like n=1 Tax=Andrographis paniculata TaxID=175694 RepID=UPI0021E8E7F5|nr:E3 ubiquitin-protein ligase MBR1-like [Andrographis paniculata]